MKKNFISKLIIYSAKIYKLIFSQMVNLINSISFERDNCLYARRSARIFNILKLLLLLNMLWIAKYVVIFFLLISIIDLLNFLIFSKS
jgi:hypothetical protein